MIKADIHMHTDFSHDSEHTPEEMIEGAVEKGLDFICFTDHYDKDNMEWGPEDIFEVNRYFETMKPLQERYHGKIDMGIGVEIGLRPYLGEFYEKFISGYPFDYVIGSVHSIKNTDPASGKIFEKHSDREVYRMAMEETLEDIQKISCFDSLGHLDYVVRYGKNREKEYRYEELSDIIDEILKALIERGKGLELNTAGLKYGLPFAHPQSCILKRYRELGGEMVTIGADAHKPEHIAYDFNQAALILKECGFEYYALFKERKPSFYKI